MPRLPKKLSLQQKKEIIYRVANGEFACNLAKEYKTGAERINRICGKAPIPARISWDDRELQIRKRNKFFKKQWEKIKIDKNVIVTEFYVKFKPKYQGKIIFRNLNYFTFVDNKTNRRININYGEFCSRYIRVEVL